MFFKDRYDPSFWQKSVFTLCVLAAVTTSTVLMFIADLPDLIGLKRYQISGDLLRRIMITFCLIIYFLRLQITVWVFQKRTWTGSETGIISIVIPFALYVFAKIGGNNPLAVGGFEVIGMLLYIAGSYINTKAEYDRYIWKLRPENKGRLYTEGLFRLSMHINYFGDIVLFTGFAMITNRLGVFIIPLFMTINFIFNIIPSPDRYLENKYKDEFRVYSDKTKKLIPKIY